MNACSLLDRKFSDRQRSRGQPSSSTNRGNPSGPRGRVASRNGRGKGRLEKYEQLLDDLQDELRDLMRSRAGRRTGCSD